VTFAAPLAVFLLLVNPGGPARSIADCPSQSKTIRMDIPHRVIDGTGIKEEAEVRVGEAGDLVQVRAGVGGQAQKARIVVRGFRGQIHLKWTDRECDGSRTPREQKP
jgi:hypothetical protein